jgi:hypothetical protein
MKTILFAAAAAALLATSAQAQDITGQVGTDNRFQGVSQSNNDTFYRGDVRTSGNTYLGASVQTLDVLGSDLEGAVYAGTTLGTVAGFSVEVQALHKWLVDASPVSDDTSFEFTANASRSFGPLDTNFLVRYSPDGYGATESFTWTEATVGTALTSNLYASASFGQNQQRNAVDYEAWNVGATYALTPEVGVDVRYYDTNADMAGTVTNHYGDAVVATLNVKF